MEQLRRRIESSTSASTLTPSRGDDLDELIIVFDDDDDDDVLLRPLAVEPLIKSSISLDHEDDDESSEETSPPPAMVLTCPLDNVIFLTLSANEEGNVDVGDILDEECECNCLLFLLVVMSVAS